MTVQKGWFQNERPISLRSTNCSIVFARWHPHEPHLIIHGFYSLANLPPTLKWHLDWLVQSFQQGPPAWPTRSIWKMLGPFATASRRTPPVLHCHSPGVATVARRHCRTPPAHRCPQQHQRQQPQQRQRVTEGTAMAPWNGPNNAVCQSETDAR